MGICSPKYQGWALLAKISIRPLRQLAYLFMTLVRVPIGIPSHLALVKTFERCRFARLALILFLLSDNFPQPCRKSVLLLNVPFFARHIPSRTHIVDSRDACCQTFGLMCAFHVLCHQLGTRIRLTARPSQVTYPQVRTHIRFSWSWRGSRLDLVMKTRTDAGR